MVPLLALSYFLDVHLLSLFVTERGTTNNEIIEIEKNGSRFLLFALACKSGFPTNER